MAIPKHIEELLEDLAASLQVPPSRYEAAERSYEAVGNWLCRETSSVRDTDPKVYIQGSFRLGTAIRPISDSEDYDVDLVCELSLPKTQFTQAQLKTLVGKELQAYARAHQMDKPGEGRRCWTLHYTDEAQFHMDILPALPDVAYKQMLLESRGLSTEWTETAIAITDKDHPNFRRVSEDWPHSNPKGYANWFHSKMREVFELRRYALALEARASVEDIPDYKVRTPLQSTIQILKRHRDMMFAERPDDKPISIILTTLAAHAYGQELTISDALFNILEKFQTNIKYRNGIAWIPNPTDPAENFADRWEEYPERERGFYEWLNQAREDFSAVAQTSNRREAIAVLQSRFGQQLMEAVATNRGGSPLVRLASGAHKFGKFLDPKHRKKPLWKRVDQGEVRIERAILNRDGFRSRTFGSDCDALPKHHSLIFEASTNIPKPYKVYWQVVNTGQEAKEAYGLRGGFDEGLVTSGKLTKNERTLYKGTHSIECFIVKNGYLAARSGQFIVNIC